MREVWLAQQDSDLTEGRGPMITKGAFWSPEEAQRCAERLPGVMGVGHGRVAATPLHVYDSFEEWQSGTDSALRDSAMAKLTSDERRVLGLTR